MNFLKVSQLVSRGQGFKSQPPDSGLTCCLVPRLGVGRRLRARVIHRHRPADTGVPTLAEGRAGAWRGVTEEAK